MKSHKVPTNSFQKSTRNYTYKFNQLLKNTASDILLNKFEKKFDISYLELFFLSIYLNLCCYTFKWNFILTKNAFREMNIYKILAISVRSNMEWKLNWER